MKQHQSFRIMGIDPGSHTTGVGVIHVAGSQLTYDHHLLVKANKTAPLHERISQIYFQLEKVCAEYKPQVVVVEQVFFGKNADSAFKLGHARGVALLAAHNSGAQILEISAREVKKILTGSGSAEKHQVRDMLCRWLKLGSDHPVLSQALDASDALSLAIAGSFEYEKSLRLKEMGANL